MLPNMTFDLSSVPRPADCFYSGKIMRRKQALFIRRCNAYWTTSDFNRAAKQFANEMGLWYLSGLALSQFAIRIGIDHP